MKIKLILFVVAVLFEHRVYSQRMVEPAFEILKSYPSVRDLTVSSTGDEAYVTVQSYVGDLSAIVSMKKQNDQWQKPELVSFTGKYQDLEPFLSPDNLKLFFASNRPLSDSIDDEKDFDIWFVERSNVDAEWGDPVNLGKAINTDLDEFYPSISSNNNLYFTGLGEGTKGKDDIFFSEWKNGQYLPPVSLSEAINTEGYEFNAYISPDEQYLVFSGYNRNDGLGSGDLYISFRDEDKNWQASKNLGANVNSRYMDYCPFIDVKNKVLYFTSKRTAPKKLITFESLEEFVDQVNEYENGLSRIYRVAIEDLP